MNVSVTPNELAGEATDSLSQPPEASHGPLQIHLSLVQRLARAKARLDRLEQDRASRDHSALETARVEFALASRALADELVARGLHNLENTRMSGAGLPA